MQKNRIEVAKHGTGKTMYIPLCVFRAGKHGLTISCADPNHLFKFGTSTEQLENFRNRLEELFVQLVESPKIQSKQTMTDLPTWRGRSKFCYTGSVASGTEIQFGDEFRHRKTVEAKSYTALLAAFAGKDVSIGTSRTIPPDGSIGAWLKKNVTETALASYVGPILIHERYAVRGTADDRIKIL
jgi:hypothetical protein